MTEISQPKPQGPECLLESKAYLLLGESVADWINRDGTTVPYELPKPFPENHGLVAVLDVGGKMPDPAFDYGETTPKPEESHMKMLLVVDLQQPDGRKWLDGCEVPQGARYAVIDAKNKVDSAARGVLFMAPGESVTVGRVMPGDKIDTAVSELVSYRHLDLAVTDAGKMLVRDRQSTNGTLVSTGEYARQAVIELGEHHDHHARFKEALGVEAVESVVAVIVPEPGVPRPPWESGPTSGSLLCETRPLTRSEVSDRLGAALGSSGEPPKQTEESPAEARARVSEALSRLNFPGVGEQGAATGAEAGLGLGLRPIAPWERDLTDEHIKRTTKGGGGLSPALSPQQAAAILLDGVPAEDDRWWLKDMPNVTDPRHLFPGTHGAAIAHANNMLDPLRSQTTEIHVNEEVNEAAARKLLTKLLGENGKGGGNLGDLVRQHGRSVQELDAALKDPGRNRNFVLGVQRLFDDKQLFGQFGERVRRNDCTAVHLPERHGGKTEMNSLEYVAELVRDMLTGQYDLSRVASDGEHPDGSGQHRKAAMDVLEYFAREQVIVAVERSSENETMIVLLREVKLSMNKFEEEIQRRIVKPLHHLHEAFKNNNYVDEDQLYGAVRQIELAKTDIKKQITTLREKVQSDQQKLDKSDKQSQNQVAAIDNDLFSLARQLDAGMNNSGNFWNSLVNAASINDTDGMTLLRLYNQLVLQHYAQNLAQGLNTSTRNITGKY